MDENEIVQYIVLRVEEKTDCDIAAILEQLPVRLAKQWARLVNKKPEPQDEQDFAGMESLQRVGLATLVEGEGELDLTVFCGSEEPDSYAFWNECQSREAMEEQLNALVRCFGAVEPEVLFAKYQLANPDADLEEVQAACDRMVEVELWNQYENEDGERYLTYLDAEGLTALLEAREETEVEEYRTFSREELTQMTQKGWAGITPLWTKTADWLANEQDWFLDDAGEFLNQAADCAGVGLDGESFLDWVSEFLDMNGLELDEEMEEHFLAYYASLPNGAYKGFTLAAKS